MPHISSLSLHRAFSDYLDTIVLCNERLIITRDFNFRVDFPDDWKGTLRSPFPLLKKVGADFVFQNLRSVCNPPFIPKHTEKAVQSAYRKNHSTETAVLKTTNDILLNMNRQHVTR